jgi:CTP:molybdopterin cytidylyltransferase MocA
MSLSRHQNPDQSEAPESATLAVLLAAGLGRRFAESQDASHKALAEHKLLATINGTPVVALSLAAMTASGLPCAVVTGAVDLGDTLATFRDVEPVQNPDFASGQRSSVLAAISHAKEQGYHAVVIGLADQPFVGTEAWVSVAQTEGRIVVAVDASGRRGNPVKLLADVWDEFINLPNADPDSGARDLIALHPEWVVQVACESSFVDIDTVEDLNRHNHPQ